MKKARQRARPRKWVIKVENPSKQLLRVLAPTKIQRLSASADRALRQLASLVRKESAEAAQELHYTVAAAVQTLNWLSKTKPELFAPIASEKLWWPIMYSPHPESLKKTNEFLCRIGLGSQRRINMSSGKTFSWKVPANVIATNLHQLARDVQRTGVDLLREPTASVGNCGVGLRGSEADPGAIFHIFDDRCKKQLKELETWGQQGEGARLPNLSKKTAICWARAADELFQIAYGRETFESHPYLQELRRSVLKRAKDAYGKSGRGVIRKAMRQAVKQAWRSIAALD